MTKPFIVAVLLLFLTNTPAIAHKKQNRVDVNVGIATTGIADAGIADAGIATAHPLATEAGYKILMQGGNAFDAAITVSAVLGVVEPYSSGFGGGGFWLLHTEKNQQDIMLDGRETAPGKATADMYVDKEGHVIPGLSITGALSAGIPGQAAALHWLAENKGKLPLSQTLQPAIDLAKEGFVVEAYYQKMVGFRLDAIKESLVMSRTFLKDNAIPEIGAIIKQPDLAHTLGLLAKQGRAGFYQGEVAEKLVAGVQKAGGIWTKQDLKNYQVKLRQPIKINYKGMKITSAALPSSGGIVLSEIFNILAEYPLHKMDNKMQIHLVVEAMRRGYRDRAEYMGDSDFVEVPVELLTSPDYAKGLRQSIHKDKATPSSSLAPTWREQSMGTDTTHFSIMDKEGNRVAATLSINFPFGSCFIPEGTGVLLNDEMDDFSAKPGTPNVYGLVGAKANAIEAGKRMLSSMSPTFIETDDRLAIIGTPGGSRIITMVLLGSLGFYEGKSAEEIVNMPRYHHQYLPDHIQYETDSLDSETLKFLKQRGHEMSENDETWGNMHIVIKNKKSGIISAASDERGIGKAIP
ncbi:MAG: gamma-glutamyltransferase [Thiotrichaceae bacterium]